VTQEIGGQDVLLRRVPDQPALWTTAEDGTIRPSSAAMKPAGEDGGLSVDVRRLLPDPRNPLSVLSELPSHGLAELRATQVRDQGLEVIHDPLPDNYAHANIVGFGEMSRSQAKRAQKELARAAAWVRMPAGAGA
jgi:hypothetical protein